MADRDARKAKLQRRKQLLHNAYMVSRLSRTPINSSAEKYYEKELQKVELALDDIAREERAEWEADGDRSLREQIADKAYGRM